MVLMKHKGESVCVCVCGCVCVWVCVCVCVGVCVCGGEGIGSIKLSPKHTGQEAKNMTYFTSQHYIW